MLAGSAIIVAVIAAIVVRVTADVAAITDVMQIVINASEFSVPQLGIGLFVMVGGRVLYGNWSKAAPVANVTGEITRTVGLLSAIGLGGMLIFLLTSGFKADDMPAAIALGVGAGVGLLLSQVGVLLRNDRTYLE
jgi:hypothetical protein